METVTIGGCLFSVAARKNLNPEVSQTLIPLINMLKTEFDAHASRPNGKTINAIIQCKCIIETMEFYVSENNWKAVVRLLDKITIDMLEKCFYRKYTLSREATKQYMVALSAINKWVFSFRKSIKGN